MDVMELCLGAGLDDGGATVEPVIGGVPLRELARPVEAPWASAEGRPGLAGDYVGLDRRLVSAAHYLGAATLSWFGDGDTVLLGCGCGEWGCWPLTTRVELGPDRVTWSGFRTGHRRWDLSALGPFGFDLKQYRSALSAAGLS